MKYRNRIIIGVIILLVGGFFAYRTFGTKPQTPTYQTATAEKGSLVTSITASGTIASGNSVNITTQASGIVQQVYVKNGETVTSGQKIAEITLDQEAKQKQTAAWASYVSAQGGLQNAQNNQRSAKASLEKTLDDIHLYQYGNGGFANVGTANETETQKQLRTAAEVAEANANQAVITNQAQLASATLSYQLTSATVIAPIAGTVTGLTLTPGLPITQTTSSSSSTNSSTASTQKLGTVTVAKGQTQAAVNLTEIDVVKVKTGQKVTISMDAFPDKSFTGTVATIDTTGSVSSGVTSYPTTIAFDTSDNTIYPNMGVNATIITDVKNSAILVPSAAVTTANGQSMVRVMRNGQPAEVTVEVGDSNDTQTEIISGINEGDTIVTSSTTPTTGTSQTGTSPFSGRGFGGAGGAVQIRRQ